MTRSLPPDRSHVGTEQRNSLSQEFDLLPTAGQLRLIEHDHERVAGAFARAVPQLEAFIDALVPRMREGGRLVYCGAGTSGRLGVLDASECPPTFLSDPSQVVGLIAGGDAALRRSSERKEDDADGIVTEFDLLGLASRDTVLAIAAGGTTPYARGAIRHAKLRGALTGFLACTAGPAPEGCDHLIVLDTGAEILTGSTRLKAGSATKLALNAITTIAFTKLGKVHGNLMVDLAASNDKLLDRAIRTLGQFDPSLAREGAAQLLHDAGGSVKVAIVMRCCGLDAAAAKARLEAAGGMLRRAMSTNARA